MVFVKNVEVGQRETVVFSTRHAEPSYHSPLLHWRWIVHKLHKDCHLLNAVYFLFESLTQEYDEMERGTSCPKSTVRCHKTTNEGTTIIEGLSPRQAEI